MRHLTVKGMGLLIGLVLCVGMAFSGALLPRAVAWDGLTYDYDSADIDVDGLDLYQFIQIFNPGDTEALAGFSEGFGSDPITVGRALLPCDAVDANQCFGKAVAASTDPDPVLRAFHSVTRIMALIENSELNGLLTDLGVSEEVRTLCEWTADFTRDEAGDPVLPTTLPSTGTALNTVIVALMAEVQGALDELSGIVNSEEDPLNIVLCEELVLPEETDSCEKIEVDYGDIALYQAFLQGLKAFLLIMDAYNLNIEQTAQMISDIKNEVFFINDYLCEDTAEGSTCLPYFLTLDTENGATQLTDAKAAILAAIESYQEASIFIQAETDDQDNDLIQFPVEQEEIDDETEFMAVLLKIQAALSGTAVIDSDEGISLDLTQFFDSAPDLRGFLPTFTDFNEINCGTINPTLGGILTGFSHDDWAEILDIPVPVSGTVSLADGIGYSNGGSIIVQAHNCWEGDPSGLADLQWCPEKGSVSLSSAGDYTIWLRTEYDAVWMIAFWDKDGDSELSPGDIYGVHGDQSFDITSTNCSGPADIDISIGTEVIGIEGGITSEGNSLANIWIYVYESGCGDYITSIQTDSDGNFSLVGLSTSESVSLYISQNTDQNIAGGWWTGSGVSSSCSDAASYTPGNGDEPIDVSLDQAGSISGTVSTEDGAPIEGVWVRAYGGDVWSWNYEQTNPEGKYTFSGLSAGAYVVYAYAYQMNYVSEYYDDARDYSDITAVNVTLGQTASGIDFVLEVGGIITGTVTRASDNAPVTDGYVDAYDAVTGDYVSYGEIGSDGNYTLWGLPAGNYKLYAYPYDDNLLDEYYDGASWDSATSVSVAKGETTSSVNFTLETNGSISGTVLDENNNPIEDVWVYAYDYTTDSWAGDAQTGSDGSYTIPGLDTGTYRVEVDTYGTKYISEYYDNKAYSDATGVSVTQGQETSGINFVLELGGTITGTVTRASDDSIVDDGYVDVYDATTGNYVTDAWIEWDGSYTVSGLAAGTYILWVYPYDDLVSEYYDGVQEWDSATAVSVAKGETKSGIDFSLETSGSISGQVVDKDGNPIADIWVYAYGYSDDDWGGDAQTDSSGNYTITGLGAGAYRVEADASGTEYVSEYFDGVQDYSSAEQVNVVLEQETDGVDFTLEVGGSISGTVSDENGDPIEGLWVYANEYDDGDWIGGCYTASDGSYTITGFGTGTYRVRVNADESGYVSEYYDDVKNYSSADEVDVVLGQEKSGIDFVLELGGTITGTVTRASDGTAVEDVDFNVYDADSGNYVSVTYSVNSDGTYTISGLPAGAYKLEAYPFNDELLWEYYGGGQDFGSATAVSVTKGGTTSGIDFSLETGGSISGTVFNEDVDPVEGVWVSASDYDTFDGNGCYTDSDGNYTITGLETGTYRVRVSTYDTGYISEYYDNKAYSDATGVSVTQGQETSGINFVLELGGTITGTVTRASDGTAVEDVDFNVYDADSGNYVSVTYSVNSDGTYTISGLPSGAYKLQAYPFTDELLWEYYGGGQDWDLATSVTVAKGETKSGINFTLETGGSISGTVSAGGDSLIEGVWVYAYDAESGEYVSYAYTDSDGTYTISGLPAGAYKLQAYPFNDELLWEYYGGGQDFGSATAVSVTKGGTTSGINFVLESVEAD